MGAGKQQFVFLSCILLLLQLISLADAQLKDFQAYHCNWEYERTYTSNSTFRRNLDTLPSVLSTNSNASFLNFTIGENPDTVYVIGLCRGDVTSVVCRTCLNDSYVKLREICPNGTRFIGWYDECMLRYWDQPIFHTVNTFPGHYVYYPEPVANASVSLFNQAVRDLLNRLARVASGGSSVRKYATGDTITGVGNNISIYALAECTPDLSEPQCNECLTGTASELPVCCDGRRGGWVLRPSCNFRYGMGRFYADPNGSSAPPTGNTTPPPDTNDNTTRTVIIVVVSTIIFVIFVIICVRIILRKRKQRKWRALNESEEISSVESLQYDFDIIRVATDEFSGTNKLGQGGFGVVYKGKLPNGRDIAVKRLSLDSKQGEPEFKNEVLLMANLQHRNLVRLIGFCLEAAEKLLIYEFLPNASLDHFIFDSEKRAKLDGDMRCKIIGGIARGLLYLHEDSRVRIIHRDLKASNILLDDEMNPKISDFGMARIFDMEETQAYTQRIVGTYGYMAPEYAMHGHFSVKSDVYSFGVLVIEILSGQKNTALRNEDSAEYLLSHAWKSWLEGTYSRFLDPTLKDGSYSMSDIMRCIHIGLLCVQEKPVNRPTMASVVLMLSSFSLTLLTPSEPTFFCTDQDDIEVGENSRKNESTQSKTQSTELSNNEVSITELSGRYCSNITYVFYNDKSVFCDYYFFTNT